MALWPNGWDLNLLVQACPTVHIERYFMNTVWIAVGSWICQIIVATTAGYALAVLRPQGSRHPLRPGPGDALRALDRAAGAALPDRPERADREHQAGRYFLGGLAAVRCQRLQRGDHQALLRQPAAGDLRGGRGRTAPGRSGSSGRSACRCRGRSSAWSLCSRSSRRGRTTSGRCWYSRPRPTSRCRFGSLPSSGESELDLFLASLAIATLFPIILFLIFQRMFLKGDNLSGAIKG